MSLNNVLYVHVEVHPIAYVYKVVHVLQHVQLHVPHVPQVHKPV